MKKQFVVVGASAASIAFITKLRSVDKDSEIMCISGEKDFPYNRCFVADYVSGEKSFNDMLLKPKEFFEQNNITLRLNSWVTKIDTESNELFIGEKKVPYDYLFLGIGTKQFIPDIGADLSSEGLFPFHTAEDAQNLSDFIEQKKPINAIVIGAGLNGLEAVSSLHDRGVAVGVVERSQRILPQQVDEETSEWVQSVLQHKGVGMFAGSSVTQICTVNNKVEAVKLNTGSVVPTNCVVLATGSVVNAKLLEDTGIQTEGGSILVDSTMRTSVQNVYAGGDICMVRDFVTKELVKSTTWSDAMLQGLCAATQFSSNPRPYPGFIGLRDSQFFGYPFYACGQTYDHDESYQVITHPGMDSLIKLYVQDDVLKGFVLIGDISKVAEYKKLYLTGQKIAASVHS